MNDNSNINTEQNTNPVETQYVDEFGNPIDPSLIDENGNYIGGPIEYVDEFGNKIDPSLIDENGNYIGETVSEPAVQDLKTSSTSAKAMNDKELLTGMVTFDYNNVPITDIVNSIILDAINKGASDIHFDPFPEGIKIRIRIDGVLHDYSIVPLYVKNNMITRIKIISSMNITESRMPQDGAIRTELANKTIDLRVACLPTSMGEKIVVRIMDYTMSAAGVEGLDFSPKNLAKVNKMLSLPNGIILVTGATGTGKSTTVYSMLQVLNSETRNIITVEDPIEMNIGGINQVQAQEEIGLNFATVLRSILREDPDVIMIGEIRDDETARIAVRASITGHLVLSTIHTNNSLNTIERLTDMSVERYLLGSSLEGVISQKLARRLCPKCKKLRPTTDYEKNAFKTALNQDVEDIYVPNGCPECDSGYRGRIAIHEVLLINQAIRDAITKGEEKSVLRKLVYGAGDTDTMLQDGLKKVLDGETSFDEILKLIDLEDDLGSGTQLGLEEQMEDSQDEILDMTPPVVQPGQPMYMPYPTTMQLDHELLKELLELSKEIKDTKEELKDDKKEIIDNKPKLMPKDEETIEELNIDINDNLEDETLDTLDVLDTLDNNNNDDDIEEILDIDVNNKPINEEELKENIKNELLKELSDKLDNTSTDINTDDIKKALKEELISELRKELLDNTPKEIDKDVKDSIKKSLKDELKNELVDELKDDSDNKSMDEIKDIIKDEIKDEIMTESDNISEEEIKGTIKKELRKELMHEIKNRIDDSTKNNSNDDIKISIKEELKDELKDEIKDELKDEIIDANDDITEETLDELKGIIEDEIEEKFKEKEQSLKPLFDFEALKNNILEKEELKSEELGNINDEPTLSISIDDDDDDNIEILSDKPIITLQLNDANTVKPIPLDEGFETVKIGKKNNNRTRKKKLNNSNKKENMEVVTIKPKKKSKKLVKEENMEVVTIKPKKKTKTSNKENDMEVVTIKSKKRSKSSNKNNIENLNQTNKTSKKEKKIIDDYEVSDKELNDMLDLIELD